MANRFLPMVWLLASACVYAAPSADRQEQLLYLLKQDCGSCHGMTLKGGLGPPLTPEALAQRPRALMVRTILDGRPDTAMPPWRQELSRDEVEWLVERLYQGIGR